MVLTIARGRAEAGGQLPAIDAPVTLDRVLQVEEEVAPAGVESVDVAVPRLAVVEARVHETHPHAAAPGFHVIVDRETDDAAVLRRHLAHGLHPPQGFPHRNRRVPHLLRVPADAEVATFAWRHRGVWREPAGDTLAGREGLPHLFESGIDVDRQIDDTVGALRVVGHVVSSGGTAG